MSINNLKELKKKLGKFVLPNDDVYIESDILNLLKNTNIKYKKDIIKNIFSVFKSLIGRKGTMICPSFTYSWGRDKKVKYFDVLKTPSETGSLAEYVRKRKGTYRNIDPMFSFVFNGGNKKRFYNLNNDSFGKNSVFEKLFESNAKLISFCLNKFDPTFVHYVEQYYNENIGNLKYRKMFLLKGKIKNHKSKIQSKNFNCLLRNLKSNLYFNEKIIKKKLLKKKMLKVIKLKHTVIYIVKAQDFFLEGLKGMSKNSKFFVSKK